LKKLLLEALARRPTPHRAKPRRPLWIMRQAGRCLPEYRELRKEHSFEELCASPDLAAQVTLQPFARFAFDAAIVFADLMSPVPALGLGVRFDPGPIVDRPLRTAAEIRALPELESGDIAPTVMKTLKKVRPRLAEGVALLGFAGAPLSLAAYLVEGQGKRGFPRLRALAAGDPRAFGELMAKLSRLSAAYLIEQAKAGADAVQIFDSWAGLLSREDWQRLVEPHLRDLLEELGRAGVPRILYAQNCAHLLEPILELPVEALSLDWRLDLGELSRSHPGRVWQGNLDPAILLAGPEATQDAARELLQQVPPEGHVVNLGHGILPQTPLESVAALVEVVQGEDHELA